MNVIKQYELSCTNITAVEEGGIYRYTVGDGTTDILLETYMFPDNELTV